VVPETKVIKLSTIEGYDELGTDRAYLGIAYFEEQADEVYAAMNGESGGVCFNRTREGYRLFLADESLAAKIPGPLDEFVTALIVYSYSEVTVTQYTPGLILWGSDVAIRVEIKKTGAGSGEYSFSYTLNAPSLTFRDGSSNTVVSMSGVRLSGEETASITFTMTPKAHVWGSGEVTLTSSDFVIQKMGESFSLNERLECRMRPVEQGLPEHCLSAFYQKSMDKTLTESYDEKLWIAGLSLFRQKSQIIIDRVTPPPFSQFAVSAGQLMRLRELESFYPPQGAGGGQPVGYTEGGFELRGGQSAPFDLAKTTSSGVFDLGLGLGYNTREPAFSEEIMHGLGKGPVYVEAGIEYITPNPHMEADSSEILLGDIGLFGEQEGAGRNERIYKASVAVKVLPERGTFVVAVLPKETSGLIALRIRWFAIRMTEMNKQIRGGGQEGAKYILVSPDTIVVPPKGTAHISPVFINTPTEACKYSLVDAEGGAIDNNGVYTAPAREGVYEIRVEAVSDPSIYTHAFAIVTQKKKNVKGK
jgi:hypothetical protein